MDRSRCIAINCRSLVRIFLIVGCSFCLGFYVASIQVDKPSTTTTTTTTTALSSAVNVVDSTQLLSINITCVKTKELFQLYRTTICIHQGTDAVSTAVARKGIWEEDYIVRLLRILIQNPHLDVIDIGSNIGTYTMFTAGALGRFTLAVDCFRANIDRVVRAVQVEDVHNRVVIVHNALYSKSGEYIQLSNGHPSGLQLQGEKQSHTASNFIVKTIRFDDLLPILVQRGVRAAIVKIDIEGSESYLVETGVQVFREIDIQLVMMEWGHGFRKKHRKRYQTIVDHFAQLGYVTTDVMCTPLDAADWPTTWPGNIYWIKKAKFRKNIC